MIVLADYENENDYHTIKGSSAFPTLEKNRAVLATVKADFEARGERVAIVTCDLPGYVEWLRRNEALNSTANVAMYVNLKYDGLLDRPCPQAKEQNITIVRSDISAEISRRAAKAGATKSAAKAAAARENGKKGGRPPKSKSK